MGLPEKEELKRIYGEDAAEAEKRFACLKDRFAETFGGCEGAEGFTSPGRTEIIGNHTDHNGGKILAASVTLDTIALARKKDNGIISVLSEGYPMLTLDLNRLDEVPKDQGTLSLVGGMLKAFRERGYVIGGFEACASSNVVSAAGISSSASFEMLICSILNYFYNDNKISYDIYARAGQYAENVYWHKASGLMDQMACACGGTILLDFHDDVKYKPVSFTFDDIGYKEILINTGKGHADLSAEYSSVPDEMRLIAAKLGGKNLCEADEEELLKHLNEIRKDVNNDRAVLRALHYYEECRRVDEAEAALAAGRPEKILDLISESGHSSHEWLQNAYVASAPEEEPVPLALALSEIFMKRHGAGVCRLHGGGFGGVIMAAVPKELAEAYTEFMAPYFGRENIFVTGIRRTGAVHIG